MRYFCTLYFTMQNIVYIFTIIYIAKIQCILYNTKNYVLFFQQNIKKMENLAEIAEKLQKITPTQYEFDGDTEKIWRYLSKLFKSAGVTQVEACNMIGKHVNTFRSGFSAGSIPLMNVKELASLANVTVVINPQSNATKADNFLVNEDFPAYGVGEMKEFKGKKVRLTAQIIEVEEAE